MARGPPLLWNPSPAHVHFKFTCQEVLREIRAARPAEDQNFSPGLGESLATLGLLVVVMVVALAVVLAFALSPGPPVVPFYPFLGEEGSPTKIDYSKKGTLILTSLLEDLVPFPLPFLFWCSPRSTSMSLGPAASPVTTPFMAPLDLCH